MRLVFFGTGSFALPALRQLAPWVSLAVSQPDRPHGRRMELQPTPVRALADELGIPCEQPEKSRHPDFVARLIEERADALVVASYGQILSVAVLESARRGGINLHGSILPQYRGAAPIQRCLLAGDTMTGVSLMQMDRGMDTGAVIDLATLEIFPDETYGQLQDRLALVATELAVRWLPKIVAGDYLPVPQDDLLASNAPKIERADAELSFLRPARDEYNRYRAVSPTPGAFLTTSTGILKVREARWSPLQGVPGEVLQLSPHLVVGFAQSALELREIQPEGKKKMSGRDFANGARLQPGSRLAVETL